MSGDVSADLQGTFSCKENYAIWYEPQYKSKIIQLVAKEKSVKKRQGKTASTPVCCFYPASGDMFQFV